MPKGGNEGSLFDDIPLFKLEDNEDEVEVVVKVGVSCGAEEDMATPEVIVIVLLTVEARVADGGTSISSTCHLRWCNQRLTCRGN